MDRIVRESEFVAPGLFREYYEHLARGYARGVRQAQLTGEVDARYDPEVIAFMYTGIGNFVGMRWADWTAGGQVPDDVLDDLLEVLAPGLAPQWRPDFRLCSCPPCDITAQWRLSASTSGGACAPAWRAARDAVSTHRPAWACRALGGDRPGSVSAGARRAGPSQAAGRAGIRAPVRPGCWRRPAARVGKSGRWPRSDGAQAETGERLPVVALAVAGVAHLAPRSDGLPVGTTPRPSLQTRMSAGTASA